VNSPPSTHNVWPVTALAARFGLGRRQFHRRFARAVGTGPKQLSQVLRAQKAAACLQAGIDTQQIIERCGYSDQSHFIRDVVRYCGKRPGELAALAPSSARRFFNARDVGAYCGMTYL